MHNTMHNACFQNHLYLYRGFYSLLHAAPWIKSGIGSSARVELRSGMTHVLCVASNSLGMIYRPGSPRPLHFSLSYLLHFHSFLFYPKIFGIPFTPIVAQPHPLSILHLRNTGIGISISGVGCPLSTKIKVRSLCLCLIVSGYKM